MGEVSRAHDTKLNRDVALTVVSDVLSHGAERMARFRLEAEVLALLHHPSVGGICGLKVSEGVVALTPELVESEDLAVRLERGAVDGNEALAIAKQNTEELEAAHEKGIVDPVLRPATVKTGKDPGDKILPPLRDRLVLPAPDPLSSPIGVRPECQPFCSWFGEAFPLIRLLCL